MAFQREVRDKTHQLICPGKCQIVYCKNAQFPEKLSKVATASPSLSYFHLSLLASWSDQSGSKDSGSRFSCFWPLHSLYLTFDPEDHYLHLQTLLLLTSRKPHSLVPILSHSVTVSFVGTSLSLWHLTFEQPQNSFLRSLFYLFSVASTPSQ